MASRWLFRPLPLRERVGRGVAPVSSTLRTRRLVVPSPPHPDPLPRGEREPEVLSTKGVIANSTVLSLDPCCPRELRGERFTRLCGEAGEPDHRSPSSPGDSAQARVNHARTGTRYRSRALDPALPHYLPCARSRLLYSRRRPYEPGSVRIHTPGGADWGTVVSNMLAMLVRSKIDEVGPIRRCLPRLFPCWDHDRG